MKEYSTGQDMTNFIMIVYIVRELTASVIGKTSNQQMVHINNSDKCGPYIHCILGLVTLSWHGSKKRN